MFKKMCIIVQCVFQFVFPNVSSVLHCLLQLFLRTFVLHKLQTTLLCIAMFAPPTLLSLFLMSLPEKTVTPSIFNPTNHNTHVCTSCFCEREACSASEGEVSERLNYWNKLQRNHCDSVEFMRSEEKLRASLNRWLLLDSSLRLLEGESIRKTETEGGEEDMCQSVQTCLGI